MSKKEGKHNNSDDGALFRRAAGDVRPLNAPDRHPVSTNNSGVRDSVQPGNRSISTGKPVAASVEGGERLMFVRDSLKRSALRELRRGKMRINDKLDLHGLTGAEAHSALDEFIDDCLGRNFRCVHIVHGKGLRSGTRGPVLKSLVKDYLQERVEVRAFCSALQSDGGTGAVYVLLNA